MCRLLMLCLCAVLAFPLGLAPAAGSARAQESSACIPSTEITADLGTPGADGNTIPDQFADPNEVHRYKFFVPAFTAVQVYVGDQWYDLDLGVYSITQDRFVGCWRASAEAISQRGQRRVLQFVRPDERILEDLLPGDYVLVVRAAGGRDFDPRRGFTVRIAVAPPACALNPPNDEEDPRYPGLKRRRADETNLYQVGMTIAPLRPDPFSLMTFTAVVSPPYTDLFDFDWEMNGQPVPGVTEPVLQWAVQDLPATPGNQHTIRLTARGVREYPDPDQPHVPPTLSVECQFRIAG